MSHGTVPSPSDLPRVGFVMGTRPEVVKVAPLIHAVKGRSSVLSHTVLTGQHREMVDPLLAHFDLTVDDDLDLLLPGQTLAELTARMLTRFTAVLHSRDFAAVVVQGDTTTALTAALACFYLDIPVVHLEAGLRTGDLASPFPEEGNRRLIGTIASLHLAPTQSAVENLLREQVDRDKVVLTGNTVIDALLGVPPSDRWANDALADLRDSSQPIMLVTAHRRESWGGPLDSIAKAVGEIADRFPDLVIVLPMHKNPVVRESLLPTLGGRPNVRLIEPLDYPDLVRLLRRTHLVLTDSGGLQEEAPSLGIPVLVTRDTTERPEGLVAGTARLVGTDTYTIVAAVTELLSDSAAYERMANAVNPYGDGLAARRAATAIEHMLGLGPRPQEFASPALS